MPTQTGSHESNSKGSMGQDQRKAGQTATVSEVDAVVSAIRDLADAIRVHASAVNLLAHATAQEQGTDEDEFYAVDLAGRQVR